jgi:hypothetical protein
MNFARNTLVLRAALLASCAVVALGSARTPSRPPAPQPAAKAKTSTVDTVVVTGFRAAYANAIATKRDTLQISDGISSDGSRPLPRPERRRGDPARSRHPDQPRGRQPQRHDQPARPARHLRAHHAERRRLRRSDPQRLDPAGRVQLRHLHGDQRDQVADGLGPGRRPVGQHRPAHRARSGPQGRRLRQAGLRIQRPGQPGQPAGLDGLQRTSPTTSPCSASRPTRTRSSAATRSR